MKLGSDPENFPGILISSLTLRETVDNVQISWKNQH